MAKSVDKIAEEIRELPDVEKLRLVDTILSDLDKPDPEIDRVWAEEARKRWAAYKAGKVPTVSYESVMAKHPVVKIVFLAPAQNELDDAVAWYNRQAAGLGWELLDELAGC
jgi:putative addiction module component (TIGR02574 family)